MRRAAEECKIPLVVVILAMVFSLTLLGAFQRNAQQLGRIVFGASDKPIDPGDLIAVRALLFIGA